MSKKHPAKTKDLRQEIPKELSLESEPHTTTAWSQAQYFKPESNVAIPPLQDTIDAKGWVDNESKK
ncbi:hypothetical protein Sgly_0166 [Syntrophobotulus glycolicus DSM 8271]|uniref:DUF3787 domain-containing protein n=1 Tax=Syntrophobotulus glycolicus (strain DSM 8271 / FlGlyR) TaxID=645991 RepID=F0SW51_SYNGF|nr:DUF3787 domain-containing protein [Syntrophobotulus glycolicus]ADY54537.1 hypothetical protein Sgly_0166 [Syntrophobotulus glycolicus DSM 8271]